MKFHKVNTESIKNNEINTLLTTPLFNCSGAHQGAYSDQSHQDELHVLDVINIIQTIF